jgi:predicted nucleic acid-binding protein
MVVIDESIKRIAIAPRKQHRLKLPDAIIAATAQSLNALLLTNDLKLSSLTTLKTQALPLR